MKKKLSIFFRNFLLFWVFIEVMPGIDSLGINEGVAISALGYGIIILVLPDIIRFFKLPNEIWSQFLFGSLMTFAMLFAFQNLVVGILNYSSAIIGGFDMIFFSVPELFVLQSTVMVILFGTIIVNACSIILTKLSK